LSEPKNRFEKHAAITLFVTVLFVLGIVELGSFGLLQTERLKSVTQSLELADYKRFDVWTLFQNRKNRSMQFDFKGVVENAEFGLDEHGFVTTANQPDSAKESIVILGGSTVFGVGASSYRTTIASYLQALLNEHAPGQFIVHNGGVRGFHSLQEFVSYINDIRPKIAPSIVISLNGRNDDHLMRKAAGRGTFDTDYAVELEASITELMESGLQPSMLDAISGVAQATQLGQLFKAIGKASVRPSGNVMDRIGEYGLPPDEALFLEPANNYAAVMKGLSAAVATDGGRSIWALQPTIFDKPLMTDEEKDRVERIAKIDPSQFGIHRSYHEAFYDIARAQELLDLSSMFRDESRTIFLDDCHYNDLGNELIAERLLSAVLTNRE